MSSACGPSCGWCGRCTSKSDLPDDGHDDGREPWCKDFDGHGARHDFCTHHQAAWCRVCSSGCADCAEDPHCPECGCAIFCDEHDWDCSYAD